MLAQLPTNLVVAADVAVAGVVVIIVVVTDGGSLHVLVHEHVTI